MVDVTGLGSLPGTDYAGAVAMTFEQVPVPYVPELPARGPHAGMIARGAATLAGIAAELTSSGWRVADAPGGDLRRARALLRDDLDRLAETVPDYEGRLRVPIVGPWTLAASLELPRGGRLLADTGARRDLAASLLQGTADLVREIARRLPAAAVELQLDEPSLPAVLGGGIPTSGGLFRLRAIDQAEAYPALGRWAGPLPGDVRVPTIVHCCAPGLRIWELLRDTGLGGVAVDLAQVGRAEIDDLAAATDARRSVLLGVTGVAVDRPEPLVTSAWRVVRELGPGPDIEPLVTITPACGLAGWAPAAASSIWKVLRTAASELTERLTT